VTKDQTKLDLAWFAAASRSDVAKLKALLALQLSRLLEKAAGEK
jgi:hypothetical protein